MNQQFLKAVRAGNRNEIERLINSNEINPSSRDSNGNSPLHIAVEIKRNEIFVITMLL